MRVRPWLEPRSWSRSNCSMSVTSAPRTASAQAAAQPITPAPTTATRVTGVSLPERPGDLHPQRFVVPAQVDLARRALEGAAVLARPAGDRVIGAENVRELALRALGRRDRELAGRQLVIAVRVRHADL